MSKWNLLASNEQMNTNSKAISIAEEFNIKLPVAQILVNRGLDTIELARRFLEKSDGMFYDPFIMKDMDKACERILKAVENSENIIIYGDYDVDGVTSVSSLYLYLKSIGAEVGYFIPSRTGDGYGVSIGSINSLKDCGCNLIITVDTGITANEEVEYAKKLGIDVIVTDHHECHLELPKAIAVVNIKRPDCEYPFKELAGVGVVYKLICALEILRNPDVEPIESIIKVSNEYLDLVSIGTIADVMPLRDENRIIVSHGLSLLERHPRPGIKALMEFSNNTKSSKPTKISSSFIGFVLAPRINAAGRIDDATLAVDMLVSRSPNKSIEIAEKLCEINQVRQYEENIILEKAFEQIDNSNEISENNVIVLSDENWHHGIIGIVASRITDTYSKPSIMISFEQNGGKLSTDLVDETNIDDEDIGKGSGRSVRGLNLVNALQSCKDLLEKFGGHELAAGLSIKRKNLNEFIRRINQYAIENSKHSIEDINQQVIDVELIDEDLSTTLADELSCLEPFGVCNTVPNFLIKNCKILDKSSIGQGKHTKFSVKVGNHIYQALYFRKSEDEVDYYIGDYCDLVVNLDNNEYFNNITLQFIIKDMYLSSDIKEKEDKEKESFGYIWNNIVKGEKIPEHIAIPNITRTHFEKVYLLIRNEIKVGHSSLSIRKMSKMLAQSGYPIDYTTLKLIIKIFQELNILSVTEKTSHNIDDFFEFSYIYNKNKVILEKSNIYKKVKQLSI